ncbi:MAG: AraC family transcriptional regulator [Roseburia sp.]|nr:AraC family transcriptional regulator [Roseburia sp.]
MSFQSKTVSPEKEKHFYVKTLASILTLVLILITFIFVAIYSNLKNQSLTQAYLNEQENIISITYSATIMNNTATSLLTQIHNDTKVEQLIYSNTPDNLETINAMNLFRKYIISSSWIDSAYIYCASENSVVYVYVSPGRYNLSFTSVEDFFDKDFLKQLCDLNNRPKAITLRDINLPQTESEQKVFTYYLPIQNRSDSYEGLFVINIHANRLMELCYGITNDTSHQIIVTDDSGTYFTNNHNLLNEDGLQELFSHIFESEDSTGQCTLKGVSEDVFCTWNHAEDSQYTFISCIPQSTVLQQSQQLQTLLVLFYCAVLFICVCAVIQLSRRLNREYVSLEKQYVKTVQQYQKNHSFVKDALLRNFLMAKDNYSALTERFSENKIELEYYKNYSLVLAEIKSDSSSLNKASNLFLNSHFALQNCLTHALSNKLRFEIADVLQNRHILIIECTDVSALTKILREFSTELSEKYGYSTYGIFTSNLLTLEDIPPAYKQLTEYFEMLYFYPSDSFTALTVLNNREYVGFNQVAELSNRLIHELKELHFDLASSLLSDFFEKWFEPLNDTRDTIDYLLKELSLYIGSFAQTYAVTMDFDIRTFQNNINRCDSSQEVKTMFINLINDIQSVFAGVGQRSDYIDRVVDIIHKNYQDPGLNVDVIADKVGLSASHMQSVFKSTTGISVSRYLRHHRLQKAAELLTDTDISINAIADQTGFGNASYFYTVFKKHYSITPTEYRMQQKTHQTASNLK